MAAPAAPIQSTPFCIVSRSESAAKRCGSHESTAMFAITRGPSTKPACAATKSSAPSVTSVTTESPAPTRTPPSVQWPNTRSRSTAFMVIPSRAVAPASRYASRIPPAVTESETAMSTIVRFAVSTLGSCMMPTPFETASMPVYVPPPSEYARTISLIAPRAESARTESRKFSRTPAATVGTSPRWPPMATTSSSAWVTRNAMKIGRSAVMDSLTPRRLSTVSTARATSSAGIFAKAQRAGRNENTASAPEAIETEMVST